MSTPTPKLTPFSFAVLVLVGEGGAGAHDLVRMMREGQHAIWSASASQWYAEPKRLAALGLLHAERTPGRTHERTHYTLTDAGRAALRAWLAEPSAFTRIQCEPIVRLLGAEYADPEVLERSLAALREPLAESYAALDSAAAARRRAAPPRARADHQPSPRAPDPRRARGVAGRGRGRAQGCSSPA